MTADAARRPVWLQHTGILGGVRIRAFLVLRFFLGPLLFYVCWFFLLTFPLIQQFNVVFYTNRLDGYQMIWNLWWVRHAIVDLHQNPFWTRMVEFPSGTSLLLHSLTPLNGLLSIPLAAFLTDIQAFNVLVVFAFASCGLTAFWLCWKVTRQYWPSLAGGFAFAFCSFRWAHYHGHLQTISSEWMVLYVLGLLCLVTQPRWTTAIGTSAALYLSLLCDQYYFLYCILGTAIILLWWGWRQLCGSREGVGRVLRALAVLVATAAISSGPMVWDMNREAHRALLLRTHDPDLFSADILGPWVPDWTWIYNGLTRCVWVPLTTASEMEKGVCIGPAIAIAALFAFFPRKGRLRLSVGSAGLFGLLSVCFLLLSFGPTWRFWTIPVTDFTPYRALAVLLPPLRFAGSVSRLIVVTQLAVAVLGAAGISRISQVQSRATRFLLMTLVSAALVIESQPRVLLVCPPVVPRWVTALRDAPWDGAVVDLLAGDQSVDLYYQTIHHRPIAMGDLGRLSVDVAATAALVKDAGVRGDYRLLNKLGFRYLVTGTSAPVMPLPIMYADRAARIYLLSSASSAAATRPPIE